MSNVIKTTALPSAIEAKLVQIRWRQAGLSVLGALAIGAAVLMAAMIVAMLIDWQLTLFETGVRLALTSAALLLAVAAGLAAGIRPLRAAFLWTRAATDADAELPQLEERWTTVVMLAASGHRPTSPTAQAMLQQVTSEAVAIGRLVQPRRVASPAALRSAGWLLAGCALAFAGFLATNWPQTSVLLRRFWSPTADITATQLRSRTGDASIPRGESVDLIADLSGLPRRSATLLLARESGDVETIDLKPATGRESSFVHRIKVDDSFRYRVRAGDGQTAWHQVTAVDYPALAEVRLIITAPEYANRPTYEKSLIPSRVKVLQGSRLELGMKPKAKLARLELTLMTDSPSTDDAPATARHVTLLPGDDGWYRFEIQLLENITLSPRLWNAHGLGDEDRHVCRIQVIADKAPVARVLSSTAEMAVASDDVLDIKFEAHDDHGIATAELVVYDESQTENGKPPRILSVQPIPLGDQLLEKHVLASTQFDLKQLNLEPGTQISYAVRVTDNRMVQLDPAARPSTSSDDPADLERSPGHQMTQTDSQDSDIIPSPGKSDPTAASNTEPRREQPKNDASQTPAVASKDGNAKERASQQSEAKNPGDGENPTTKTNPASDTNSNNRASSQDETVASADGPAPSNQQNGKDDAKAQSPPVKGADSQPPAVETDRSKVASARSAPSPSKEPRSNVEEKSPPADSPPPSPISSAMAPQQSESGQNAETDRRRLRITERLAAVAASQERRAERTDVRDRVVRIDELLRDVETGLTSLVNRELPDADRSEQARRLDGRLGDAETAISDLRNDTRDQQFAFVGLQMLDIGRTHVTPARERVFVAIREPVAGTDSNSTLALQHVIRARELLAALLARYDRVARDENLADSLKEAAKMYEVYVERSQQLMREARQNRNPLARKMAILELDQEYLDRYAEVLTLRREMMSELGRILSDDPRLLARYMEFVKRRRSSLRDQLSELAERQSEIAVELSGWLQVGDAQREDLWTLLTELRLQAATPLAKDAAELAERLEKQLPLVLEPTHGTAARVVQHAQHIATTSRAMALDARRQIQQPGTAIALQPNADKLVFLFGELDAALEQLSFEHEQELEITSYVTSRLLESRTVADQADAWVQIVQHIQRKQYHGLTEVDQQKLAIGAELLRIDMLSMEAELEQSFQQQAQTGLPAEIADLIRELHGVMEGITFHQAAATFAMSEDRLKSAAALQTSVNAGFERAEALFDRIRREVAAAQDEFDVPNPTVADLRDPTLDEFLAQLEREPNIEAQLGLPDRPRNLRVIADSMLWQQNGAGQLDDSSEAAIVRAKQAMREKPPGEKPKEKPDSEMTKEEREQRMHARQMEAALAESLKKLKERANDPSASPQERQKLQQMAKDMERMLDQMGQGQDSDEVWNKLAESAQAKEILRSLARGEGIPDQQWNKLLSTLDDGLWQVGGRTPPEEYRRAIDQYQERLRRLMSAVPEGSE